MKRVARAAAALAATAAALDPASLARADAPVTLRGERMVSLPANPLRAATEASLLEREIPAQPWGAPTVIAGVTGVTTPALALPDGGLAVGTSSRGSALVRVDASGAVASTTQLTAPPSGRLALGADGRVFVWSDVSPRSLFAVAPDGTLRGAFATGMPPAGPPVVRPDGSVVLVASQATGSTAQWITLSPDGDWLSTRLLRGPVRAAASDGGECVWLLLPYGVACARSDGTLDERGFGAGASEMVALGGGAIALHVGPEVQVRSATGALLARIEAGAGSRTLAPLPGGGLAVTREGPPPELAIVARDGSIAGRTPIPGPLVALLADRAGAILVVANDGAVVALEPNGALRWTMDLPQRVAFAAPAPGGGVVLSYETSGALALLR